MEFQGNCAIVTGGESGIGRVAFDPDFTRTTACGLMPLLLPPPPGHRDATDIAFASSCLVHGRDGSGDMQLYDSLEDRMLRRATVRRFDR